MSRATRVVPLPALAPLLPGVGSGHRAPDRGAVDRKTPADANKVHHDGAKAEEPIIQVWGTGPATSTPAEKR